MAKFHEKAIICYGLKQSAEGTPVTPLATNPIAALNMDFSTTNQNESFQYTGDELSRDEFTTLADQYAEMNFETMMPYIGTMPGAGVTLPAASVPFKEWFESCGGFVTLGAGTGDAASCTISNSAASNALMTIDVRRSSADIATQKSYKISDARGTIDLNIETGKRAMLKFAWKGNLIVPVQAAAYVADFGTQKSNVAPVVRLNTLIQCEIVDWNNGSPSFTGGTTKNFCFSKLSAANLFGFDYTRFLTGCQEGFSKGATPTDVTITMLEDAADAVGFQPEPDLGLFKAVRMKYAVGGVATPGKNVQIDFTKLQLTDYKNSAVGSYAGKDATFRNVGYVTITFS